MFETLVGENCKCLGSPIPLTWYNLVEAAVCREGALVTNDKRMNMVWGLELPYGFGPFFPDGDLVGYDEQLEATFSAMTTDEKAYYNNRVTTYQLHVSQCFTYEHGTMHGEQRVFRPVADYEWPREFRIRRQYRRLGSLIKSVNSLLLVDKALKDIIEHLEPDVHQFRPTKLTFTKDEAYPKEYFTMVIGTFLTSFDQDQSGKGSFKKLGVYHSSHFDEETASKLAFRKSILNGHHLWRERELKTPHLFLSDGLQSEISKAGLILPKDFPMKEV